MIASPHHSAQLATIADLRWRMFVNSLRTVRGQLELVSRMLVAFAFIVGGLGGAMGMGFAAFFIISVGRPQGIAGLFWFVFIFWQVFPIMATAFANNPDSSDLLRFPLSYRSFFLVRMAYGAFDPASILGGLWSLGILLGVGYTKPTILPWALLVVFVFVSFNLACMQMIFAWIERWLARRRTREIMGILLLLLMLSFQLIGPLMEHFGRHARPEMSAYAEIVVRVQGVLPPGLAGDAIAQGIYPRVMPAISSLVLLCGYLLVAAYFLHVRLRAQYRGENLSEVAAMAAGARDRTLRLGWDLPGLAAPVAAVFEKEIRYILRSGPMLINLAMPLFLLVIFRFGAMNPTHHSGAFLARAPDMAFPAMAGYTLLMLINLVCNSFGGDGGGIQFFLAAPVSFREIVLGKNLAHGAILAGETLLAWIAVTYFYGRPAFDITVATVAGLLFAAPVNFLVGNLLSIYWPKKLDYSSFRGQRPSQTGALISFAVEIFVVGIGVAVFFLARSYGNFWIATFILLILAGISLSLYGLVLNRIDRLVRHQGETLVAELCKA
jgi:ABC-2 type transport system permease protein